ncbi:hypothetical protein llap_2852 [Limosa lapponica baueri]|uniref:Uncharacterized protein n=1 Tax=Limosa lapponica baueri TaxID=1758121 RepID=A0A2I0ULF9_LIMLA|nr:hypothetical protein llap_2852 [Limosa lapponica baueri]
MAPLAPLHDAKAPLHDTITNITGGSCYCPTIGPASPSGVGWEAQPPHLTLLQDHLFHLPSLTIIFLIATSDVNPSLSHLLMGCHLLCPDPQEKGMRQPSFHRAAALWQQESSLTGPPRSLGPGEPTLEHMEDREVTQDRQHSFTKGCDFKSCLTNLVAVYDGVTHL